MLDLNRPGELSAQEARELAQHLETCSICSAQLRRIRTVDRFVEQLRQRPPITGDSNAMVNAVLAEIRRPSPSVLREPQVRFIDRLMDLFFSRMIRFSTAGIAVASIVLFLVQEVTLLGSVHALEGKIVSRNAMPTTPEVAYSVSEEDTRRNPDLLQLKNLFMLRSVVREDGGIVVARRIVEQFADGVQPGSAQALRLASTLGRDPRRIASLLAYVQRNSTIVFMFDNRGQ